MSEISDINDTYTYSLFDNIRTSENPNLVLIFPLIVWTIVWIKTCQNIFYRKVKNYSIMLTTAKPQLSE